VIEFLRRMWAAHADADAIIWQDQTWTYGWLLARLDYWAGRLDADGVASGTVVSVETDFSPDGVALFLALTERACIVVPLTGAVEAQKPAFLDIATVQVRYCEIDGHLIAAHTGLRADHAHYATLRSRIHPGLVLFSSGSTGTSKAAVHDLCSLLEKFTVPRRSHRAIAFLLYDHIGGVNTMLYMLANAGCIVTVADRSPETVLAAVSRHRVGLLPTSPTFLNLILLSEAWRRHDLSSLRTVTYGTEPMPESTLRRFHEVCPHVVLQQTYGLSEVGILRSQSRSSDSLWMKIGGEGFETRVVDGLLQIRAQSAMLGYLNAPSPFTADGWFPTGDAVEVDGEYIRVLGRQSELINVGGEKVFPSEVESVLLQLPGVLDATVAGEANAITGQIVTVRVNLAAPEAPDVFKRRMRTFCRDRLASFKIPARVTIVGSDQFSARFKKMRHAEPE